MNNLPKVVTWKWNSWELNSDILSHESNAIVNTSPSRWCSDIEAADLTNLRECLLGKMCCQVGAVLVSTSVQCSAAASQQRSCVMVCNIVLMARMKTGVLDVLSHLLLVCDILLTVQLFVVHQQSTPLLSTILI